MYTKELVALQSHLHKNGSVRKGSRELILLCENLGIDPFHLGLMKFDRLKKQVARRMAAEFYLTFRFDDESKDAERVIEAKTPSSVSFFYTRCRKARVAEEFERLSILRDLIERFGLLSAKELHTIEMLVRQRLQRRALIKHH